MATTEFKRNATYSGGATVTPPLSTTDPRLVRAREAAAGESITQSTPTRRRRGRRPSHAEHWTKVTVVLMDREIVFLDRLSADIRAANGCAISRAPVIRALIEALAASDIDLTTCRSERELAEVFTRLFQHRSITQERA
jgi:hypothetical protein